MNEWYWSASTSEVCFLGNKYTHAYTGCGVGVTCSSLQEREKRVHSACVTSVYFCTVIYNEGSSGGGLLWVCKHTVNIHMCRVWGYVRESLCVSKGSGPVWASTATSSVVGSSSARPAFVRMTSPS